MSVVTVQGEYTLNKTKESFGLNIIDLITLPPQVRTLNRLTFPSYRYQSVSSGFAIFTPTARMTPQAYDAVSLKTAML